jgi:sirohydrochlorin ferrochelatase
VTAAVLVAHGSRDPAAAATVRAMGAAVAAARPDLAVRTAFLGHTLPRPERVLAELSGTDGPTVVVPLLLTDAFHTGVDLPAVLARLPGGPPPVADVLGPPGPAGAVPPQLVAALRRRLPGAVGLDAVVLAAAGTRHRPARGAVEQVARAFGAVLGLPCRVGYASGPGPAPGEAAALLRREGAGRVGVAAYFVASGRLYRAAAASARAAGAVAIAAPLGTAPELTELIVARIDQALAGTGQQKGPGVAVSGASPLAC